MLSNLSQQMKKKVKHSSAPQADQLASSLNMLTLKTVASITSASGVPLANMAAHWEPCSRSQTMMASAQILKMCLNVPTTMEIWSLTSKI